MIANQFTSIDDRAALNLYEVAWRTCPGCRRPINLAEALACACPGCGLAIEPGPGIGPVEAAGMLAALRRRRRELLK
jgi:predicted amidophosphoribosyltransferase